MPDRLEDLHRKIDDLNDPNGDFSVVCPLNGKRPVPVEGRSFPSAAAAEDAVDLVREYRSVLREVDPHLENLPIVVVEETAQPLRLELARERTSREDSRDGRAPSERAHSRTSASADQNGRPPTNGRRSSRSITLSGDGEQDWLRIDNAPVVTVREDGEPLGDAAVERQLNSKL